MKKILLFTFLILNSLFNYTNAQIKLYDDWTIAQNEAIAKNKDILIILTGSDWCKPCIKMKKKIIETPEFEKMANDKFVIFEINLPRHMDLDSKVVKDYNFYKEKYKTNALPSLILVTADGTEIRKFGNGLPSKDKLIKQLSDFN